MRRFPGKRVFLRAAEPFLLVLVMTVASYPLHGEQTEFDIKAMVQHLAAIEEKKPYRLRVLARNGRPTLIAFIDHQCYTCLRSVEDIEQLIPKFIILNKGENMATEYFGPTSPRVLASDLQTLLVQ